MSVGSTKNGMQSSKSDWYSLSWFSIILLDKYNQILSLIIVDRLLFLYDVSLNFEYSTEILKILY